MCAIIEKFLVFLIVFPHQQYHYFTTSVITSYSIHYTKLYDNYGEVFERNVGVNTPLMIERGLNALWTNGGLMYTPPFK